MNHAPARNIYFELTEAFNARTSNVALASGQAVVYRPAAPLDVRWLSGGWSSHVEFADARARRVRCDFISRPPRVPRATLEQLFAPATAPPARNVVDIPTLIALKQTQRAKDYAVIAELAARADAQ